MMAYCAWTKRTSMGSSAFCPRQQQGVALVMALVILLIMTLLGITAMGTSSLEEKMAGNIQEATRVFEAAESGLNSAFSDSSAFNLNAPTTKSYTFDSGKSGSASVTTTFLNTSNAKRSANASGAGFKVANFEQTSTATTLTGAKSEIRQGVAQAMQDTSN